MKILGGIGIGFVAVIVFVSLAVSMSGYNTFQRRDEIVSAAWAGVMSVYQKRADMVPNLAATVERYASHEKAVLEETTKARSAAGQTKVALPRVAKQEDIEKFAAVQREMSGSLTRLLAVAENYPQLKADNLFLKLQSDLKDIESQATASRNRYIREVAAYNMVVRSFPTSVTASIFGYTQKKQLQFDDEAWLRRSPKVFGGR